MKLSEEGRRQANETKVALISAAFHREAKLRCCDPEDLHAWVREAMDSSVFRIMGNRIKPKPYQDACATWGAELWWSEAVKPPTWTSARRRSTQAIFHTFCIDADRAWCADQLARGLCVRNSVPTEDEEIDDDE